MLLKEKNALLKWNPANKKKYIDFGYEFTSIGEEFVVKIEHLTPTTRALVYFKCDYCMEECEILYKAYIHNNKRSHTKKDCCSKQKCIRQKMEESCISIYGESSSNSSEIVKNNKIKSMQEKYGVNNPFELPEVKEKWTESNLKKYGVENPFYSKEFQKSISGENHYAWKGGTKTLQVWVRNQISPWVKKTFEYYDGKCIFTGLDKDIHVHHIYPFNQMLTETLEELKLDLRETKFEYGDENLKKISDLMIEKHEKNGLGVCLHKEVHILFHKLYGREGFTLEDFNEFAERVGSGEFNSILNNIKQEKEFDNE